jgi:hypothetical protein
VIGHRAEEVRGLEVFISVPFAWFTPPGNGDLIAVTDAHAKALERANVKFEYVSKRPKNAGASSVQP